MGISALINPIGKVEEIIPHGEMDFVDVKIQVKLVVLFILNLG